MTLVFEDFFRQANNSHSPRAWQRTLGESTECVNRLIPKGTGMGKTLGLASAWVYHRLVRNDNSWPRRLAWCLPMRVLVEQTADELTTLLKSTAQLLDAPLVPVHVLMGGVQATDWHLDLEQPAVLIGTQDMLLSPRS